MKTLAEAQEELYSDLFEYLNKHALVYDFNEEELTEYVDNFVTWETGEVITNA